MRVNNQRGKVPNVMNTSFCEVAVDPETGETEVTKYVVVYDPGKVLNALAARGESTTGCAHRAMLL
jgi:CO/xanthine dehydrogenase Mo-binding subunit